MSFATTSTKQRNPAVATNCNSEFGYLPGEVLESGAGFGSFNGYTLIAPELDTKYSGGTVRHQNNLQFQQIWAIGQTKTAAAEVVPVQKSFQNACHGLTDCFILAEIPLVYADQDDTAVQLPPNAIVIWSYAQRANSDVDSQIATAVATQYPIANKSKTWSDIFYSVGIAGGSAQLGCNTFPGIALFGSWYSRVLNAQTGIYQTGSSSAQTAYRIASVTNGKVGANISSTAADCSLWHAFLSSFEVSQVAFPTSPKLSLYGFQFLSDKAADATDECDPCSGLFSTAPEPSSTDLFITLGLLVPMRLPTKGYSLEKAKPQQETYLENPTGFQTEPVHQS